MRPAIRVENISKRYQIGGKPDLSAGSFRDLLGNALKAPIRRLRNLHGEPSEKTLDFWALDDVSFEVVQGEIVGLIGGNGAGKSTMLRVLSRVTSPTKGRAVMRGVVSPLLEVGTGFHPDLTGRENIYLNGAILGMKRAEVAARFDEIVAFAEIDDFIDTPVKRYSSGMFVRLAFAVAAHLNSDIMIVDEVLAVGDARFQEKCLSAMGKVADSGRVVLYVSHNMASVQRFCSRALLFEGGKLVCDAAPREAITRFLFDGAAGADETREGSFIRAVRVVTPSGGDVASYDEGFEIEIAYVAPDDAARCWVSVQIVDSDGDVVLTSYDRDAELGALQEGGFYVSTCETPPFLLVPDRYAVRVTLIRQNHGQISHEERRSTSVKVIDVGFSSPETYVGKVRPLLRWERRHGA